jgi:hypothetical protein
MRTDEIPAAGAYNPGAEKIILKLKIGCLGLASGL